MRILLILLLGGYLLFPLSVSAGPAGPGHSHSTLITKGEAAKHALNIVKKLADRGKLEKSWLNSKVAHVEKKIFKNGPEWVVMFNNFAMEKNEHSFFIFLSLSGKALAANYTGK